MTEQEQFKCLRCGNEYSLPKPEKAEMEERTCPKCRSNSVRKVSKQLAFDDKDRVTQA